MNKPYLHLQKLILLIIVLWFAAACTTIASPDAVTPIVSMPTAAEVAPTPTLGNVETVPTAEPVETTAATQPATEPAATAVTPTAPTNTPTAQPQQPQASPTATAAAGSGPLPVDELPGGAPAPPPIWQPNIDQAAWLQEAHTAITQLANWANGDPAVMVAQMQTWGQVTTLPPDYTHIPTTWIQMFDFDVDGQMEILLSAPLRGEDCSGGSCQPRLICDFGFCPATVYLLEQNGNQFEIVHQLYGYDGEDFRLMQPLVVTRDDLNNDGRPELVISEAFCGAHTCTKMLQVGQWDGQQWHDLGKMSQPTTEISITDWNLDGLQDIVLYGGIVGSAGAGLQRPHTLVYTWQNGRYQRLADIPDPSDHPYYLMYDAHTALSNNEHEEALALATKVLNQPFDPNSPETLMDEWGYVRVASYAAIEAMLVHALQGNAEAIPSLLEQVTANYDKLDNPYVAAAQALWQTYQDTQDPLAACLEMGRIARANPEQAKFFQWEGYNTELIPMAEICPLAE